MERMLVVTADVAARRRLVDHLEERGYRVEAAADAGTALRWLHRGVGDAVWVDVDLLGALGDAVGAWPGPVVFLGAAPAADGDAPWRRPGAYWLSRPWAEVELAVLVRQLEERERLLRERDWLRRELDGFGGGKEPVGEAPPFRAALAATRAAVARPGPVLFVGEGGSGRRTLAGWLHARRGGPAGPLLRVCARELPDGPTGEERLRHLLGAARGGMLLLLEVGELAPCLQRVLAELWPRTRGEVRLAATTARNLGRETAAGTFRRDLYRLLSGTVVTVPPLRERAEDVPALVAAYLQAGRPGEHRVERVAPEAMELLVAYRWPGNVAELVNLVGRWRLLDAGPEVTPDQLPPEITGATVSRANPFLALVGMSMHDVEREMILRTLDATGNNKTAAAKILGLTARTLHNKLRLYRELGLIPRDAYRPRRKAARTPAVLPRR